MDIQVKHENDNRVNLVINGLYYVHLNVGSEGLVIDVFSERHEESLASTYVFEQEVLDDVDGD